ncbi:MAG TPA: EamA family transporter [Anaerolineales bacterium]|nr:EamA family transporter [Anaerolineales bacterium]
MLTIIFGIFAAATWGAGDFAGGLASRHAGVYQAALYGEAFGVVLLLAEVPFIHEPAMPLTLWIIDMAAGAIMAVGLMIFYRALGEGQMSVAAPVSALMTAGLPVIATALMMGLPSLTTLAGFALALLAVWMVSQSGGPSKKALVRLADVRMPLIAGLFFGIYFILIHLGSQHAVLWPLLAARSTGTLTVLVICAFEGEVRIPQKTVWLLIALNAAWDVGGNAFYILAGQVGRMDVAAVLSSLYPGITVILARIILREKLTGVQFAGILAALVAIVLMTI